MWSKKAKQGKNYILTLRETDNRNIKILNLNLEKIQF